MACCCGGCSNCLCSLDDEISVSATISGETFWYNGAGLGLWGHTGAISQSFSATWLRDTGAISVGFCAVYRGVPGLFGTISIKVNPNDPNSCVVGIQIDTTVTKLLPHPVCGVPPNSADRLFSRSLSFSGQAVYPNNNSCPTSFSIQLINGPLFSPTARCLDILNPYDYDFSPGATRTATADITVTW